MSCTAMLLYMLMLICKSGQWSVYSVIYSYSANIGNSYYSIAVLKHHDHGNSRRIICLTIPAG